MLPYRTSLGSVYLLSFSDFQRTPDAFITFHLLQFLQCGVTHKKELLHHCFVIREGGKRVPQVENFLSKKQQECHLCSLYDKQEDLFVLNTKIIIIGLNHD